MKNVVVIPVYKKVISETEIISLKRCFEVLGKHDIVLVAPQTLDLSFYFSLINTELKIERFKDHYFQNIAGYNSLQLSVEFYERFLNYDYMLIYQLDCYVFRDELDYWCKQSYDYIGAPWLSSYFFSWLHLQSKTYKFKLFIKRLINNYLLKRRRLIINHFLLTYHVGNGGFSLRNIKKFVAVLKTTEPNVIDKYKNSDCSNTIFNEDVFWSFEAKGIRKPGYKKAAKFSLEESVDVGIGFNKGALPFGCHAWVKNYHYWENIIKL